MRTRSSSGVPSHLSLSSSIHEFLLISLLHMRLRRGTARGGGGDMGLRSYGASGAWLPREKVQRHPTVEAAPGEEEQRQAKVAWGCSDVGHCRRRSGRLPLLPETSLTARTKVSSIPYSIAYVRNPSHIAFLRSIQEHPKQRCRRFFSLRSLNIASSSGSCTTLPTILGRFQLKT
jgi:hypothetical protein